MCMYIRTLILLQAINMSYAGNWYGICSNQVQDCHSWVAADGKGFMNWDWTAKGSDGLVFGPLPNDELSMEMRFFGLEGAYSER